MVQRSGQSKHASGAQTPRYCSIDEGHIQQAQLSQAGKPASERHHELVAQLTLYSNEAPRQYVQTHEVVGQRIPARFSEVSPERFLQASTSERTLFTMPGFPAQPRYTTAVIITTAVVTD